MSLPDCAHDLAYKHVFPGGESYCCACLRQNKGKVIVCPECGCREGKCDGVSFICQLAKAEQLAMAAAFETGMLTAQLERLKRVPGASGDDT